MKLPVVVFAAFLSMFFAATTHAEVTERAVVVSSEPSNAAWTGGSLVLLAQDTEEPVLTLSFKMPRGRLTSMIISGRDWALDLTRQVSGLETPFPTRAQARLRKVDSKRNIKELWLSLPYGLDKCSELEFEIVNGRLVQTIGAPLVSNQACGP